MNISTINIDFFHLYIAFYILCHTDVTSMQEKDIVLLQNQRLSFQKFFQKQMKEERITDGGGDNFQHLFQLSENNQSDENAEPGGQAAASF